MLKAAEIPANLIKRPHIRVEAGGVEPPSPATQPETTTCLVHRFISILQSGADGHLQDPARMELSAPDARTPKGDPSR